MVLRLIVEVALLLGVRPNDQDPSPRVEVPFLLSGCLADKKDSAVMLPDIGTAASLQGNRCALIIDSRIPRALASIQRAA